MKVLNSEALRFRGMRQEVSQLLKKAIFDGVYDPGEQIYEAELAKQLELSRGPIREALLQLEKESLVKTIYNKGWFVLNLTPDEISEITSLRVILEVVALRLAKEHITNRQILQLRKIQKAMLEDYLKDQITEAIQQDFEFHQRIWECSGHRALEQSLVKVTTPYFAFFKMSRLRSELELEAFRTGLENHKAMIDYLAGQIDKSAEWCIRSHFAGTEGRTKNWHRLLDALHQERI